MKIFFYQSKDEYLSINLLFRIIKQFLPASLEVSTIYFSYNGSSSLARINDIVSVAFKGDDHISHVTGDFNYATLFMPKGKTVLTIHDLYRLYLHDSNPFKKFLFKYFWLRLPIARATVITAVSHYTKAEILKHASCRAEKIKVIYNCISPDFKPVPKVFDKAKPVLLQVGTRPNKNLDRLAQALEGIDCRLQIIGEPTSQSLALFDKHHIDFSWSSNLSAQDVLQQYIDCDMLVFVSTYEGFGMPIIEANAVERAVVTGNISAMAEIAGDAACLVDPFNIASIRAGIIRVISDDVYREELIQEGRKNKQRFEAGNIARQYYDLYREIEANNISAN